MSIYIIHFSKAAPWLWSRTGGHIMRAPLFVRGPEFTPLCNPTARFPQNSKSFRVVDSNCYPGVGFDRTHQLQDDLDVKTQQIPLLGFVGNMFSALRWTTTHACNLQPYFEIACNLQPYLEITMGSTVPQWLVWKTSFILTYPNPSLTLSRFV